MFEICYGLVKDKQDKKVSCVAASCSIGKADSNLIILHGWQIAKTHASFIQKDDELFIKDEGSAFGVKLNGVRITSIAGPLNKDDLIEIGGYTFSGSVVNKGEENVKKVDLINIEDKEKNVAPFVISDTENKKIIKTSESDIIASDVVQEKTFAALRKIQEGIITQMDFRRIDTTKMSEAELREKTKEVIEYILDNDSDLHAGIDRSLIAGMALHEAVGLGPLETLLADDSVSEIMVNRYDEIFVERSGKLQRSDIVFSSDRNVLSAIERIIAPLGRRIDESSPMVDGRLKDGSRVNAIIPPLALKGPCITIRKFSKNRMSGDDLIRFNSANENMIKFLRLAVEQRRNIVISGGTGSGKTTLLNIMSNFIPNHERLVTIEDAAELRLIQPNLVSMEARPANVEGKGAVTIRDLVRNSLRMRPDRIVVGECRGGEALDMLQAMNTGHDGSLTTAHANTPRDALSRLEVMVLMAGMELPLQAVRQQISSAVQLIVQQTRFSCGSRKITNITEVTGMENGIIQLQDIFYFKQKGFSREGKIQGEFVASGAIPDFYEDLSKRGIDIDRTIFKS